MFIYDNCTLSMNIVNEWSTKFHCTQRSTRTAAASRDSADSKAEFLHDNYHNLNENVTHSAGILSHLQLYIMTLDLFTLYKTSNISKSMFSILTCASASRSLRRYNDTVHNPHRMHSEHTCRLLLQMSVGYQHELCKMAEPIKMTFGGQQTQVGSRNHVLDVDAHWHQLVNVTE